ncbi:hypothetical protein BKA67DRAFT_192664 [Truncatella angustata]|uniref:DUF6536 domain-containing protein n=1 Tax=Truncatella angustata TaxID=152316 RepID=A0A9P9A0Z8_9PEZI|nr:uncharacterized protein BKA67DRAFT_192664 [Truncatella angustata]KAH6657589.1 hypothetical protein BKA67DRAFT_192664 [Truncatella angustata]
MHPIGKPASERWRRTGIVNLVLVAVCAASLLGSLVASITRSNSSINTATIIYEAECSYISRLNLSLHLLINLVSSGVLASSNFYMQVLSSPSRKEIDHTHEYLKSLDIGIPSVKNIRFISPFKQICWAILLLSSFPLHLIFNSAVFETGYQGSYWNLTIATEAFTQGAGFYAPGASLSPAGSPSPAYIRSTVGQPEHQPTPVWKAKGGIDGYGQSLDIADYWDENSLPRLELAATALVADSWSRLDPKTCLAEYRSCNPRKNYGNVVVVVNSSASSAAGWTRSEVFHFDPQSNLSSIWDSHIPPNVTNSLWYSAQCKVTRSTNPSVYDHCEHTCLNVLGLNHTKTYDVSTKAPDNTQWTLSFQPVELNIAPSVRESLGYNDTFNSLDVNYCLALPVNKCKIGVSNTLVLIVLVCILVKLLTCVMVIRNLTHHMSLITPGDAMESFISRPDTRIEGLGTLDITDSERLEFGPRTLSTEASSDLTQIIRPRRWQTKPRRYIGMVPRAAWTRTYCLLFCAIVFLVVCVALALDGGRSPLAYAFGHTDENLTAQLAGSYIGSLLVANTPQLILSLCYFSYNTFFTRLAVETEWNSFSLRHQPLRVSYPVGKQVSKYRLQLPYRYSIPLLAVSILLHWLVSNSVYIFITEGGKFKMIFNTS